MLVCRCFPRLCQFLDPRALLSLEYLHASLGSLQVPCAAHPNNFEPSFLVSEFNPDDVARRQRMLDPGERRAVVADIASVSILKEGMAVCSHPPHSDEKIDINTRLQIVRHAVNVPLTPRTARTIIYKTLLGLIFALMEIVLQRTIRPRIPEWFKLREPCIRSGSALAGCCRLRVAWTARNGRKYAWTLDCRLRKVISPDRDPFGKHAPQRQRTIQRSRPADPNPIRGGVDSVTPAVLTSLGKHRWLLWCALRRRTSQPNPDFGRRIRRKPSENS